MMKLKYSVEVQRVLDKIIAVLSPVDQLMIYAS